MGEKLKEVLFEAPEQVSKKIKMKLNIDDLPLLISFENRREYILNHTDGGGLILRKKILDD